MLLIQLGGRSGPVHHAIGNQICLACNVLILLKLAVRACVRHPCICTCVHVCVVRACVCVLSVYPCVHRYHSLRGGLA